MNIDAIYRMITAAIPDWLMFVLAGAAAAIHFRLWLHTRWPVLWWIIMPATGFALYYLLAALFGPDLLFRLAGGRGLIFFLMAGLIALGAWLDGR